MSLYKGVPCLFMKFEEMCPRFFPRLLTSSLPKTPTFGIRAHMDLKLICLSVSGDYLLQFHLLLSSRPQRYKAPALLSITALPAKSYSS
jgi:hypothetical protein